MKWTRLLPLMAVLLSVVGAPVSPASAVEPALEPASKFCAPPTFAQAELARLERELFAPPLSRAEADGTSPQPLQLTPCEKQCLRNEALCNVQCFRSCPPNNQWCYEWCENFCADEADACLCACGSPLCP